MDMFKKLITGKWMKIGIAVGVIIVVAAGVYIMQQTGLKQVETQVIAKSVVSQLIKETGTVESEQSSLITAKSVMEIKGLDFKEGDAVKAGQVILQTDITAAQLAVKSMESEAASLRILYSRAKDTAAQSKILFSQGAISQADYLNSEAAKNQLASQVAAMDYSIESTRKSMDAGGITAPIDGIITQVFVKVGDILQPASPILEISDLTSLYLTVNLIAEDADLVKVGNKASVYTNNSTLRDDKAFVRKIHLKAFDLVSDLGISQKRVKTEITLSDTKNIRLGNSMNVDIIVAMQENVIAVPKKAVFELNQSNHVYVVEKAKTVLRQVELGLKGEDDWEVISGLVEGEIVVISPDNTISEGTRVKI